MTDLATPAAPAPFRRPPMKVWPLTVVDGFDVTPRMRRLRLIGETMDDFAWRAGQDLVLNVPVPGAEAVRRHYTIRSYDAPEQRLEIDFVLHGDGPAANWAQYCELGDTIDAAGPRGRTVLNENADWHLFVGDETAIPGIAAMLEGLPHGTPAHAFIEIADDAERQSAPTDARIVWLSRNGAPPGPGRILYDAVEAFALPPGRGHAYVIGETSNVRAIRQRLIARGMAKDQIAAEGYWRPGRIGGHDHV